MKRSMIIQLRAESICESIHDGDAEGVARFGTYLDEVGDLTSAVETLTATTTIADLVAAYINTPDGEAVMFAWAKDAAGDEQFEAEEDEAERRAA